LRITVPQRVCLVAAVLPLLTFAVSYLLSAAGGHVDWCNPYIDGCTTITATGIYYPGAYVLRGGIVSSAVVFVLWWYCTHIWLKDVKDPDPGWGIKLLIWVASLASLTLVASMVILGENMVPSSDHRGLWNFHSITAVVFFVFTSVCQIIMTLYMWRHRDVLSTTGFRISTKMLLAVIQALILAVLIVALILGKETDWLINTSEWWIATLCSLFYLTSYSDWKAFRLMRLEQPQTRTAGGQL